MPDVAHRRAGQRSGTRNAGKIAFDQSNPGALHGDVSPGAHRHADIGLGERRRIVHAVTGHCHGVPLASQAADNRIFLFGQNLGFDLGNAEPSGDGLCRGPIVARQHDDANAVSTKTGERRGRRRFDGIGDRDDAGRLAVDGDKYYRCGRRGEARPLALAGP